MFAAGGYTRSLILPPGPEGAVAERAAPEDEPENDAGATAASSDAVRLAPRPRATARLSARATILASESATRALSRARLRRYRPISIAITLRAPSPSSVGTEARPSIHTPPRPR